MNTNIVVKLQQYIYYISQGFVKCSSNPTVQVKVFDTQKYSNICLFILGFSPVAHNILI